MRKMTLRETQIASFEVLRQFDEICQNIGVKYFLIWGTLIGAIRHQGFIPWDDDLDIAMFPEDFEKTEQYFYEKHPDNLELHNMKTVPECFYNISRICDKKHKLIFDNKAYTSGVFVDIYVMYGIGKADDLDYWKERFKKYPMWQKGVYASASRSVFIGRDTIHKILNIPFNIYSKLKGKQYFVDKFNSFKKYDIENSDFIGCPQWETAIFKKSDFLEVVYLPFEDFKAPVPAGYDHFLRSYYGDYMTLPPTDQRKPYHGYTAYEL